MNYLGANSQGAGRGVVFAAGLGPGVPNVFSFWYSTCIVHFSVVSLLIPESETVQQPRKPPQTSARLE